MSEHDTPVPPDHSDAARPGRIEEFLAGVYTLRVPSQTERRERRLYWGGIVLALAGLVAIGLGWWGASGTKYVYRELPYVISGGIFGVALVFLGAVLFARYSMARLLRYWLARLVADQQIQTDRVVDAIEALTEVVAQRPVSIDDSTDRASG
jgi:peptidoglycan/LPS O-acetylase OafA/YrhL